MGNNSSYIRNCDRFNTGDAYEDLNRSFRTYFIETGKDVYNAVPGVSSSGDFILWLLSQTNQHNGTKKDNQQGSPNMPQSVPSNKGCETPHPNPLIYFSSPPTADDKIEADITKVIGWALVFLSIVAISFAATTITTADRTIKHVILFESPNSSSDNPTTITETTNN